MPLPKISEARDLDDQALETAIVDTRKRLFDLRFQQAIRQLEGGLHQFKHERHRLAQLMTVLRERQLAAPESLEVEVKTEVSVASVIQNSVAEVAEASVISDTGETATNASSLAADETSTAEEE